MGRRETIPIIPLGPVKAWSFSTLMDYELCPYKVYLAKVEKSPRPPVDEDSPLERGNRIHKDAERFVLGEIKLARELKDFAAHFESLRTKYKQGKVKLEEDWAHARDLSVTEWRDRNAWLRLKCDAVYFISGDTICIIDYKTGRKFGNEIKHAQQGQLYAGIIAERYPEATKLIVEFWYTDQDDITTITYTRRQAGIFLSGFLARAERMTTAVDFPPKPSVSNCRYCDFGTNKGTGVCGWAVKP